MLKSASMMNRAPLRSSDRQMLPVLMGAFFLVAGAVVGLVVATGNLILIALALGGIAGLLLLNALPVAVWLLLAGVLLINGPVGFFSPGMAKVSWLFSLLGIFMAGAAVLYSAVGARHFSRPMPAFIYLALAFIVLAVISSLFSDGSLAEIAAGAKRHFHFWGVMFLLAVVPFTERQVRGWMLFLVGVALAQLPLTLYQRLVLVPSVLSFDRPGFVPFDIIVGTFEGSLTGGGASAIMAMFQVLVLFGLFCAWRERLMSGFWAFLLGVAIILPLGLGETKVVLALIPVVLFSAYFELVTRRPLAFLGMVLATLVIGAVLGYFYFIVQTSGDIAEMSLSENIKDTIEYNFGDRGYYGTGVNRFTAIPYWFESQSWNNPVQALFGTGIGSSYGIDGLVPDPGHIFLAHPGMHIDLLTASAVLWEFGLVGALLYFGVLLGAIRALAICFRDAESGFDRVLCRMLMASLATTLMMTMYSNSAVVTASHSFIMCLTLGLVAWRYRHGPMAVPAGMQATPVRPVRPVTPGGHRPDGGWGAKVIFPTEGLLSPAQLEAQRSARALLAGTHVPGAAAGSADSADQVPPAAAAAPAAPAAAAPATAATVSGTAAAGAEARPAFPKGSTLYGAAEGQGRAGTASIGGTVRQVNEADAWRPVQGREAAVGTGQHAALQASMAAGAPASPPSSPAGAADAPELATAGGRAANAPLARAGAQAHSAFPRGASLASARPREGAVPSWAPADQPGSAASGHPSAGHHPQPMSRPEEPKINLAADQSRPMFADDDWPDAADGLRPVRPVRRGSKRSARTEPKIGASEG